MSHKIYIGPRGGKYYISKNNNKIYITNKNADSSINDQSKSKKSFSRSRSYNRPKSSKSNLSRSIGSYTRGWKDKAPKKGNERHLMSKKCPNCFLLPHDEKFPICGNDCKVDCRGINAAYNRAREYKYKNVENKAKSMQLMYKCNK